MPRKGRLVQPRHIFPWIAAPYIEMLRLLWRIERFFFLPIRYLQAWTISAIFGVVGVLFSVALFIPRLASTQAQASSGRSERAFIKPYDMPVIRDEDLALPPGYEALPAEISVRMQRTHVEDFDQNERRLTHSKPFTPKKPLFAFRDEWARHITRPEESHDLPFESYVRQARVHANPIIPMIPDYVFDPGIGDFRAHMEKAPTLLIKKSVPKVLSPDEPLTYIITVTNNGNEPVEAATVEEYVSDINRVIDSEPRAMVSPDYGHLIWDLAQILPQETRHLSVTIQPDKRRPIAQETLVSFSSEPIIGETMVRQTEPELPEIPAVQEPEPVVPEVVPEAVTRPVAPGRPKLVIEFDPSNSVKVGQEVEAYYTVTNVGTADATAIRLLVEVPAQLRHRFGKLVEHKISRLAPNESRRALFAALAEDSGRMPLHWTLEAAELENQSDSEWLAVLPGPKPAPARSDPATAPVPTRSSPTIVTTPPVKSSIPASEPTPVDVETPEITTNNRWRGGRGVPADEPSEPSLSIEPRPLTEPSSIPTLTPSSIPSARPSSIPDSPGPSSIPQATPPSTIPSWADPVLGSEPASTSIPQDAQPIDPELMPDEPPLRENSLEPPQDLAPLELGTSPFRSTIPPEGLPDDNLDGAKPQ